MEKIRIWGSNLYQTFALFLLDKKWLAGLFLAGFVLCAVLGISIYQMNSPRDSGVFSAEGSHAVTGNKGEVLFLSSDLFYQEKAASGERRPVMVKLYLTGTGKVKGVYKASVEDASGNYYYVQEGQKARGWLVKKIRDSEAEIVGENGEKVVLKLGKK
jgi:hypothetical protein